jgi:hypothetical protein
MAVCLRCLFLLPRAGGAIKESGAKFYIKIILFLLLVLLSFYIDIILFLFLFKGSLKDIFKGYSILLY